MPALLVALGGRLNSEVLLPDVDRLTSAGLEVHLVTWASPSPELAAAVGDVVVLHPGAPAPPAGEGDVDSEKSVQAVLEHAEDSLSAGDLPGSERLEESLDAPDEVVDTTGADPVDPVDGADEIEGDEVRDAAATPRTKATGPGRVVEVAGRAVRNPAPYAARVYVLARRRARPLRRALRRRTLRFRANLHRPRATAAFLRNPRARRLAQQAEVLVAVDSSAILAVWAVVRDRDDVLACVGVDAALVRRAQPSADA